MPTEIVYLEEGSGFIDFLDSDAVGISILVLYFLAMLLNGGFFNNFF